MLSSLLISRKAVEISHTHVENYMHARAGLDFVSCHEPTKRSQPGGWQPPPPQKVATSIYCIIIQPFSSHLFLAHIRLSWLHPPMIQMMRFKFQGGVRPGVYQNRLHYFQEEDEMMARACVYNLFNKKNFCNFLQFFYEYKFIWVELWTSRVVSSRVCTLTRLNSTFCNDSTQVKSIELNHSSHYCGVLQIKCHLITRKKYHPLQKKNHVHYQYYRTPTIVRFHFKIIAKCY